MKLGNIERNCKYHGNTNHAIYYYGDSIKTGLPLKPTYRCLECEKEKRAKRYANPEKRAHDLAYTKQWALNNKDHCHELGKQWNKRKQEKILNDRKIFLKSIEKQIQCVLDHFESDLTINDFTNPRRYKLTTYNDIVNYIIEHKKSKILDKERWKSSTLIKYHYGVRGNYKNQPQELKDKIMKEATDKAKIIADKKIKELCATI